MQGHQVIFAGNVGDDVKVVTNGAGKKIVKFPLYQDVNPMRQGGKSYANIWNVECWDKLAQKVLASTYVRNSDRENANSIKGARIMVSGWVDMRPYMDGSTGRVNPTIVADEIAFSCQLGPLEVVKYSLDEIEFDEDFG